MVLEMPEHAGSAGVEQRRTAGARGESGVIAGPMHRPDADHRRARIRCKQGQRHQLERVVAKHLPDARLQQCDHGEFRHDPASLPPRSASQRLAMDQQRIRRAVQQRAPEPQMRDAALDIVGRKAMPVMMQMRHLDRMHRTTQQYAQHEHHHVVRTGWQPERPVERIVGHAQAGHEQHEGGEHRGHRAPGLAQPQREPEPWQRQAKFARDLVRAAGHQIAPDDGGNPRVIHGWPARCGGADRDDGG